jgi:hypothetical protein
MKSESNISIIVKLYGDNDNDDNGIIIDDNVGGFSGKTFNIKYYLIKNI